MPGICTKWARRKEVLFPNQILVLERGSSSTVKGPPANPTGSACLHFQQPPRWHNPTTRCAEHQGMVGRQSRRRTRPTESHPKSVLGGTREFAAWIVLLSTTGRLEGVGVGDSPSESPWAIKENFFLLKSFFKSLYFFIFLGIYVLLQKCSAILACYRTKIKSAGR